MVFTAQAVEGRMIMCHRLPWHAAGSAFTGGAFCMQADFYKSTRWERKRRVILRRDGYQCQLSKRYGRLRQADVVHHIFPLEEFPEFAFASWNLISLTRATHNSLHDRNTDELTREGRDLLRRTARRQGIEIPTKYMEQNDGRMA